MSRADKKQRKEAKRKARKMEIRRRESVSPLKRLGDTPGEMECWMSEQAGAVGQVQCFVYKRAAGLTGLACFLVDRGVVGLKDAYTLIPADREHLDRIREGAESRGIGMKQTSIEQIRNIVAGSVRWAHAHGMRLPKDWHKTAAVIGGVGDWASADVSKFVKEFAGHPEDLRRRLIGESLESFMARTDITFIFSDAAPYMDQETGRYENNGEIDDEEFDDEEGLSLDDFPDVLLDEIDKRLTPVVAKIEPTIKSWLADRNQPPSSEIAVVCKNLFLASLLSAVAQPDGDRKGFSDAYAKLFRNIASEADPENSPERTRAYEQLLDFMRANPLQLENALRAADPNGGGE
jgi:hypothetical protein